MVNADQVQKKLDAFCLRIEEAMKNIQTSTDSVKTDLGEKIDALSNKLDGYDEKIKEIEKNVQKTDDSVQTLTAQVANNNDSHREKFEKFEKRIAELEEKLKKFEDVPVNLDRLAEKVEDRTNRQLRETLVFKNVPEVGENDDDDDYQYTKELVAKIVSDYCNEVSYDEAIRSIKRAHRERKRTDDDEPHYREGKRFIFVAFHSWDLCQTILKTFRLKNINDRHFTISVEQKYGPMTTQRRSLAFQERKKLIDEGTITSGFVAFPARLLVNYPGEMNARNRKVYKSHSNFSKHKV